LTEQKILFEGVDSLIKHGYKIVLVLGMLIGIILTLIKIVNVPEEEWNIVLPENAGLNNSVINDVVDKMHNGDFGNIDGLVVLKDGNLVVDEYDNNYTSAKVHTVQSVTKSITSLLIGIAIDQGKISSEDEKVIDYFQDYNIENLDDNKKNITIKNLLTMTGGFDWDELEFTRGKESPIERLNRSTDWVKTSIDSPMKTEPGSMFRYNSGGVIILDHIIKESTGMHSDEFAENYLFSPLGINKSIWLNQFIFFGTAHTGGGLYLTPKDLAKIGQLIINKGVWDGKQIVSEEWIDKMTAEHIDYVELGLVKPKYGYLFWLYPSEKNSIDNYDIITCSGKGGQYLFVIPEHNMVVVLTASNYEDRYTSLSSAFDILYNYILKSLA